MTDIRPQKPPSSAQNIQHIVQKVDIILEKQTSTDIRLASIDTHIEELDKKYQEIVGDVSDLSRTIRGFNGTPGLVTQLAVLNRTLEEHLLATKEARAFEEKKKLLAEEKDKKDKAEKEAENTLTFKYLVDKGWPIITAIIVFFLLNVIPHVADAIMK